MSKIADKLVKQGIYKYQNYQFQAALESWQQVTIYQKTSKRRQQGAALGNIGVAYEALSNYHLAIESYQQHLNIAREIQDREGVAKALGNLANAYYALENYQQAVTYQQQYLAIAQEILDESSIQQAYSN